MRRKTPFVLGIAMVVVAFAWGPTPAAAAIRSASAAQPTSPDAPRADIRRALAGRVSGGSAVQQPKTTVGCTTLFSPVASPNNIVNTNELEAVAPISPTDIWSVGLWNSGATNAPDQTLSEHWN